MNPNLQLACNYAVLRFLPYPETGEFVNLGVAAHCPGTGHFGSKFETTRTKRVTTFFPELPVTRFRAARLAMANELERVGAAIRMEPNAQLQRRYFQKLVRPREAIFGLGKFGRSFPLIRPSSLANCSSNTCSANSRRRGNITRL